MNFNCNLYWMRLMTEFERIFGNEFFIIDSNNLKSVKQDFYGYAIQDNELIQRG